MLKLFFFITLLTVAHAQDSYETPVETDPAFESQWSQEESIPENHEAVEETREPASDVPVEESYE